MTLFSFGPDKVAAIKYQYTWRIVEIYIHFLALPGKICHHSHLKRAVVCAPLYFCVQNNKFHCKPKIVFVVVMVTLHVKLFVHTHIYLFRSKTRTYQLFLFASHLNFACARVCYTFLLKLYGKLCEVMSEWSLHFFSSEAVFICLIETFLPIRVRVRQL